jgi:hypothetical protein
MNDKNEKRCELCGKPVKCDDKVKDARIYHFVCAFNDLKEVREYREKKAKRD